MTIKNRLGKLDQNLSAKQFMLLMIDDMQQCESLGDYSMSHLVGKWNQIGNGLASIREGIRASLKGCDKAQIEQIASKAHRESIFLYLLLCRVMSKFQGENYRHAYTIYSI